MVNRFRPRAVLVLPFTVLTGAAAVGQTDEVKVYQVVEVRGDKFIPEEDIRLTCGDLVGIELDDMQLQSIEDCLMYTGVFEKVTVSGLGTTLLIEVTEVETRPGRLDVGVAWVNDAGLTGTIGYEQFNLIPDTYLGVTIGYSDEYASYGVNLYREDTFGPTLHFGVDLAGERASFADQSFSTQRDLAEIYLASTPLTDLRLEFGLGYREQRLFDVEAGASPLLLAEAGEVAAPFVHLALAFQPGGETLANAVSLRLDQYLWNLGTEERVAETRLEAAKSYDLTDRLSLHVGLRGGVVVGQGGYQTTALDRGFVGGETLRGFAPRGIGPSDAGDFLGGNRYLAGSVEVQRSFGEAMGTQIRGGIFMDFGSVWSLDNTLGGTIDDTAHLRSSVGLSLTFGVANVPVSLYLATPVQDRPGDNAQVFGLSAAARF